MKSLRATPHLYTGVLLLAAALATPACAFARRPRSRERARSSATPRRSSGRRGWRDPRWPVRETR